MTKRWPMALGLVAGLAAVLLGLETGMDQAEQWARAARWTARIGLPIFLVAYCASSFVRLWPSQLTRAIMKGRRWWGLGFAACHTVHLYALIRAIEASGQVRTLGSLVPGGLAYLIMYLMALTSNDTAVRLLGRNWKRLHTVGIHYLWLIFTLAYSLRLLAAKTRAEAIYGVILCLGALAIRLAARRKRQQG